MSAAPPIVLRRHGAGSRLTYRRLEIGPLVHGMPASAACTLLPRLLPVCAGAQRIAAERAVGAALETPETCEQAVHRGRELLREQGLAAAWRLFLDWPRALGEPPCLEALKALRGAGNEALAEALEASLPPCADDTPLHAAIDGRQPGDRVASRLLRLALDTAWPRLPDPRPVSRTSLQRVALACLAADAPVPVTITPAAPRAVGPLAMARHPRIAELVADGDVPAVPRLLLAQWLDMHAIAAALREGGAPAEEAPPQLCMGPGIGLGTAVTARGPLFHRVVLDGAQRVRRWDYLAPTDWHFAPGGLVQTLAAALPSRRALQLLLAAADPCAATELQDDGGTPVATAA